jgi:hypothetical protein
MGGQACVFYGAAQFSKGVDFVLLGSPENLDRLRAALAELDAQRIASPRFDPAVLARGHAVHFRCRGGVVDGLRVDVMTHLRAIASGRSSWRFAFPPKPKSARATGRSCVSRSAKKLMHCAERSMPKCAPNKHATGPTGRR